MNLLHLEYFYTVAKEGGYLKASKRLSIQQPAISRMVKQLEEDFGFRLFEKVGRNVRLSVQGQAVYENCKRIFSEVEDLERSLGKINKECRGPLTVACAEVIASHYLPAVLEKLLAKHPLIHPSVFSGPASMLLDKIVSGDIELGLFFHTPQLNDRLEVFQTCMVKHRLVIRKDLKNNKNALQSFFGSREVDDMGTKKFPALDRLKRDHPLAKIKISSNNITAHKEMVKRGMGVAILPDFLIREEIKSGEFSDLYPKENFEFELKLVRRRTATLSLNAEEFVKLSFI